MNARERTLVAQTVLSVLEKHAEKSAVEQAHEAGKVMEHFGKILQRGAPSPSSEDKKEGTRLAHKIVQEKAAAVPQTSSMPVFSAKNQSVLPPVKPKKLRSSNPFGGLGLGGDHMKQVDPSKMHDGTIEW